MRPLELEGKRFGKLTVIERVSGGSSKWLCHCDCGNDKVIYGTNLVNGSSVSCGCAKLKHLDSRSKLYGIHSQMKIYGVVEEWKDYNSFKAWAMENGYEEGVRVSRIDTSLPFGPDNCRVDVKNIQGDEQPTN